MKTGNIDGKLGAGIWQTIYDSGELTDADSYTKLLLHCDESSLYDVTGKTVTKVGTAALSTVKKKFGIGSCLLDGDSDYLSLADSDDWSFGSGDFTIDCWINFNAVNTNQQIINQVDGVNFAWWFGYYGGSNTLKFYLKTNITEVTCSESWTPSTGIWYHLAVVRSGDYIKIFVDGTQLGSDYAITGTANDINEEVRIGVYNNDGSYVLYFNGYIDEIRISKGIARWTSNFTPPTEPYTSKLTSLTINGLDGDNDKEYRLIVRLVSGSNTNIIQLRPNNDSGNNYGYQYIDGTNTTASAARGDTGIASIYLNYNTCAINNLSFTDCLIYAKSGYIRTTILSTTTGISGTTVSSIGKEGNSWNNTADNITSLVIFSNQTNGLGIGSRIILMKKSDSTSKMKTGILNVKGRVKGTFQKIFKTILGSSDSYTKLLIHGNTITDETGKTVTANGNAAVTTDQYKFTELGKSIVFDGTSDYLSLADSDDWSFGSGDFTIECWFRPNTSSNFQILCGQFDNVGDNYWEASFHPSANLLRIRANDGARERINVYCSFTPIFNTWYHIAFIRNGTGTNCIKIYVNGEYQTTTLEYGNWNGNFANLGYAFSVGARNTGSLSVNGYISEFRLSKGIARWTSNFTPQSYIYGPITSLTITGLDGNTDQLYRLKIRGVNGYAGGVNHLLRINNDSGNNYGIQKLEGNNTTTSASRTAYDTVYLNWNVISQNNIFYANLLIYVKSGYVRTFLHENMDDISGTTVSGIVLRGNSWNDTSNNVTSLVIYAGQLSGLGAGTSIELEAYRP